MIPENGLVMLRVPNWIGDAVMVSAAVAAIRDRRPETTLLVVCKPWVRELFIPGGNIDERIVYAPRRGPSRMLDFGRLVRRLRSIRPAAAVLFQPAIEAGLMAWMAGIPVRVGIPSDHRRLLLTDPVPVDPEDRSDHLVHIYLSVASTALGEPVTGYVPRVYIPPESSEAAKRWIETHLDGADRFLAVAPGAAYGPAKRWPADRFAALIRRMSDERSIPSVCFGGIGDRPVIDDIRSRCGVPVRSVAGELSLTAQAALIDEAGVCVANDSGLMHVSAATTAVTVAIFGPTPPGWTRPYGDRHFVLHKPQSCAPCRHRVCPEDHRCMTAISVDDVFRAVDEAFRRRFSSTSNSGMIGSDGIDEDENDSKY